MVMVWRRLGLITLVVATAGVTYCGCYWVY